MKRFHKPVLLKESLSYLKVKKGKKYIDATLGGGGHTLAILKLGGKVLGIDCDPEAIKAARELLSQACPPRLSESNVVTASWRLARGNFVDLKAIAAKEGFGRVRGILFDLGVSSHQLDEAKRGFSFSSEGPLDMRMSPDLKVTAADLINGLTKAELYELFSKLAEEKYPRRLANFVDRARRVKPIKTGRDLADVIVKALPKQKKHRRHPATRVFLALRILVNDELENLRKALPQAMELLGTGGRLVVISFHSKEDRIVKKFFQEQRVEILTRKPIRPTDREIEKNPRARSAKLRAVRKL